MKSQLLVLRAISFASFSFRFRKLATTSAFVLAALSPAPLWANPMAEKAVVDRSTYVTVIGGRLGNASDATFSADPTDDKIGHLQPLTPGSTANFAAISMGQRIDPHWDWKASVQSTVTDEANSSANANQWANNTLLISSGDFELGYDPTLSPTYDMRVFAGARVVRAKNDIGYRYDQGTDKLGTYSHQNEVKAIGPRLGMTATIPMGQNGPRFVSSVSGAVLFGTFDGRLSYMASNEEPPPDEGIETYSQDKTVSNTEMSVGLQFDLAPKAILEIGYRAETWHDLLNSVDDAQSEKGVFSHTREADVKFQGPYLALTWKFGS